MNVVGRSGTQIITTENLTADTEIIQIIETHQAKPALLNYPNLSGLQNNMGNVLSFKLPRFQVLLTHRWKRCENTPFAMVR